MSLLAAADHSSLCAQLHSIGVVHGDIKPDNIMRGSSDDAHYMLTDFSHGTVLSAATTTPPYQTDRGRMDPST